MPATVYLVISKGIPVHSVWWTEGDANALKKKLEANGAKSVHVVQYPVEGTPT